MKKQGVMILIIVLVVLALLPFGELKTFGDGGLEGAGTIENPYIIYTADDFNEIRNNMGAHYKLGADIDLEGYGGTSGWEPIGNDPTFNTFFGSLDGNGYEIRNLSINLRDRSNVGLFGYARAEFSNLKLVNVDISVSGYRTTYVGALIARAGDSNIDNVSVSGTISHTGHYTGGLVGNGRPIINRSSFEGSLNASENIAGGLMGSSFNGTKISNSYVKAAISGRQHTGGLVGVASDGETTISNSYVSLSHLSGEYTVGGLTGSIGNGASGIIENSYVSGKSTTSINGGVSGTGTINITNSFVESDESTGDILRMTDDMKKQNTYIGWDFNNVWKIDEGSSFPYLRAFIQEVSVSLDLNGGSADITELMVEPDSLIEQLPIPTRANYIFTGWYKDEDLREAWDFSTDVVTEAMTLYAGWELEQNLVGIPDKILPELVYGHRPNSLGVIVERKEGTGTLSGVSVSLDDEGKEYFTLSNVFFENPPIANFNIQAKESLAVGTYTATVTVSADNTKDLTFQVTQVVTKARPEVVEWPTASAITYGESLSASMLSEGNADMDGTFAFKNEADKPNAGTHEVEIVFTPLDTGNYELIEGKVNIEVNPKELTIGGSLNVSDKEYDGTNEAIINPNGLILEGLIAGDNVDLQAIAVFSEVNVGQDIDVAFTTDTALVGLDASNYTLTLDNAPTTTANITPKELTVIGAEADNKVYDGTEKAMISGAQLVGVIGEDDVTLAELEGAFTTINAGENIPVTAALTMIGEDIGNYRLTQPEGLSATIEAKELTIGGTFTVENKIYDGTTDATIKSNELSLVGIVGNDEVELTVVQTAYGEKNAGTNKEVHIKEATLKGILASNYQLSLLAAPTTEADIIPKKLTVEGSFLVANKEYDGTTEATIAQNHLQLNGIIGTDVVRLEAVAAFTNQKVAEGIAILLTEDSKLVGDEMSNYYLSLEDAPTTTANITPKELTVIGAEADNKVYDGTEKAMISGAQLVGVIGEDDVTLAELEGAFTTINAGENIPVTAALTMIGEDIGNYRLTQPEGLSATIEAKELTIGGTFTVENKIYDGTEAAEINNNHLNLEGIINEDEVELVNIELLFTEANAEKDQTVLINNAELAGRSSINYRLILDDAPTTTATIAPKEVTVGGTFTVDSKVYDGTASATVLQNDLFLEEIIAGDDVRLDEVVAFTDSNVGENIEVTLIAASSITGADAANYFLSLEGAPTTRSAISTKELTVIGAEADNKVYDGTAKATISGAQLVGVIGDDEVTLAELVGAFASTNVGESISVTTELTLAGDKKRNYSLTQPEGLTAAIKAKELIIGGSFTVLEKTYDGTNKAKFAENNLTLTGIVGNDEVTLSDVEIEFSEAGVSPNKVVTINRATLNGANASNYRLSLEGAPTGKGNIIPKIITVSGSFTVENKEFDGKTGATLSVNNLQLFGIIDGDTIELQPSAYFINKNVGENIEVILSETSILIGENADNYRLSLEGAPTTSATIMTGDPAEATLQVDRERIIHSDYVSEDVVVNITLTVLDIFEHVIGDGRELGIFELQSPSNAEEGIDYEFNEATGMLLINKGAENAVGEYLITYVNRQDEDITASVVVSVLSGNAFLHDLEVYHTLNSRLINFSEEFDKNENNYILYVGNHVREINVSPTLAVQSATVTVNGIEVESGTESEAIELEIGENEVEVMVIAEDGVTKMVYKITIYRSSPSSGSSQPLPEEIVIDVETVDGNNRKTVAQTPIQRITETNGMKRDVVTFDEEHVQEIVEQLQQSGQNRARINIPDVNDEVFQINVTLPTNSIKKLVDGNVNLEINTNNARLTIMREAMENFEEDVFFRIVPVKDAKEREGIKERAKQEEAIRQIAPNFVEAIEIIGRPMTIETNMQNRLVTVTLPLETNVSNEVKDNLIVFIEHTDGTKQILRGRFVEYEQDREGFQFEVNKFSTFTLVFLEGASDFFDKNEIDGYISGFHDGTFRPDEKVTRAQMAAMLARNLDINHEGNNAHSFTDVNDRHWAYKYIERNHQKGIMNGYTINEFRPEESLTRAQMAMISYRWIESRCSIDKRNFDFCNVLDNEVKEYNDVSEYHWANEAIKIIRQYGIMDGYIDNTFRPEEPLTRAEAVVVLNRLFNIAPAQERSITTFNDVSVSHWAFKEIEAAVSQKN